MNEPALTPDDTKRMQENLKRDPQYVNSRNTLLWVSVLCAVFLSLIGLMIIFDRISMAASMAVITGCVMVYLYFIIRVVKMRNAAEARWMLAHTARREKKKERKKNR